MRDILIALAFVIWYMGGIFGLYLVYKEPIIPPYTLASLRMDISDCIKAESPCNADIFIIVPRNQSDPTIAINNPDLWEVNR